MLKELLIKDFAIINEVNIQFEDKMTAMTGETGAGKSIIIDALGLLTGGRGSIEFIKTGAQKAVIQGLFDISKNSNTKEILDEQGIEYSDSMLVLKREFSINGRNVCRANGELISLSILAEIGHTLVNIHGQNQSQAILNEDNHLGMLDGFADSNLITKKTQYVELFNDYKKLKQKLYNIQKNSQELAQRKDMLEFQIAEIDEAKLQANEEDELVEQRDQLSNFDKISNALNDSYSQLSGSIVDATGGVMEELNTVAEYNLEVDDVSKTVTGAYYQLQDAMSTIQTIVDGLDYSPETLDEIQKRLLLIQNLEKKYGPTVNDVISFGENAKQELLDITDADSKPDKLMEDIEQLTGKLKELAHEIHSIRVQTATRLSKQIKEQLNDLYMDKAEFQVKIDLIADFIETGSDVVTFELKTNPGEDFKPLVKIASGGELSRIMLALEVIMSKNMNISTVVFDEIDTGVSGRVAQAIANKIFLIAQNIQVLCITHLPQVAAMSNTQLYIKKAATEDTTSTAVSNLNDIERIDIIAQMLSGTKVTELAKNNAEELLKLANNEQKKLIS
ncbi:DNA repair protein RecN [Companilactobacillus sp. RD055328]|uniref:DNA repair protein RecN n=1 Tax=Companilactobacillus sp. RD055328 TaxID=2916634 RepID=UPI001FC889A0|nr:DNA repair protein RecN [Companilactobacillus sp. RD055328]GKQ42558.1 DNA repair protein RecN [Companilactobacillus sp. RD055328]